MFTKLSDSNFKNYSLSSDNFHKFVNGNLHSYTTTSERSSIMFKINLIIPKKQDLFQNRLVKYETLRLPLASYLSAILKTCFFNQKFVTCEWNPMHVRSDTKWKLHILWNKIAREKKDRKSISFHLNWVFREKVSCFLFRVWVFICTKIPLQKLPFN